jgi:hypothetical protein
MPVGYRGRATGAAFGSSVTVAQADFDVAPQAGDLLVAITFSIALNANGGSAFSTPSGWSRYGGNGAFTDFTTDEIFVDGFTKSWSGSDTTYTFATSTAVDACHVLIVALSSANNASPTDGFDFPGSGAPASSQVLTSVSPAFANGMLIGAAATSGTSAAYTATGTMTNRGSAATAGRMASVVATEALTSAGATGTRTFTAGVAGNFWAGAIVAIREQVTFTPSGEPIVAPSVAALRGSAW